MYIATLGALLLVVVTAQVPHPCPFTCPGYDCQNDPSCTGPNPTPSESCGYNCTGKNSTCCGAGLLYGPSCMPGDGSTKCCTHYLAATVCDANQDCCGYGGPGASSESFCCSEGTKCCQAGTMPGVCCDQATAPVCCGVNGPYPWCCGEGRTCGQNINECL